MNHLYRLCFVALCAVGPLSVVAYGSATGISGRSGSNGTGCGTGSCHGTISTVTTLSILQAIDGKLLVAPGSSINLTLRVSNNTKAAAGCDIAVKTSKNGLVRAGTLKPTEGSGLYLLAGELTHVTPRAMDNGGVNFDFSWQAPASEGTYYLQAAGNAVNANGSSSGDAWAFMQAVELVVSTSSSVDNTVSPLTSIFPVPAHNTVTVTAKVNPGSTVDLTVFNAMGTAVFTWSGSSNTDNFTYVWDGRMNDGSAAPQGTYTLAVLNQRKTLLGKAIIIH